MRLSEKELREMFEEEYDADQGEGNLSAHEDGSYKDGHAEAAYYGFILCAELFGMIEREQ